MSGRQVEHCKMTNGSSLKAQTVSKVETSSLKCFGFYFLRRKSLLSILYNICTSASGVKYCVVWCNYCFCSAGGHMLSNLMA